MRNRNRIQTLSGISLDIFKARYPYYYRFLTICCAYTDKEIEELYLHLTKDKLELYEMCCQI